MVWQWHAPELWRRATIALRRALAGYLGVTDAELRKIATVQYAKVAEFQARGLAHFHALIRLDGPDGPGSPAPVDGLTLAWLVEQAVRGVQFKAAPVDGADVPRVLRFGVQLDARTVRTGRPGDLIDDVRSSDELHAGQVAGYLAKYATKATARVASPVRTTSGLNASASHCLSARCQVIRDLRTGCWGSGPGCSVSEVTSPRSLVPTR